MEHSHIIERIKEKVEIVQDYNTYSLHIDEIVATIKMLHSQKLLVPVICEDMYEYVNPDTQESMPLHSHIVEEVINRCYKIGNKIKITLNELDDVINKGYFGLSLLESKIGGNTFRYIYSAIFCEDGELCNGIRLKQEVKDFLEAGKFPLIITTNCFPILEKELSSNYSSYWNEINQKNDAKLPDMCIYHIFGKAKVQNSNWGYNDKQILNFLKSAYSDAYEMKNLATQIVNNSSRQTLMILGNDTPDWLFRFMLRSIYGNDVYDDGIGYYINDKDQDEDRRLTHFLSEIKFTKESQLIEVLKNLTNKMSKTKLSGHNKKYDFFVAHASEDKNAVRELVVRLRENGLNVWVDYETVKDGVYWQTIINALNNSAYFMPFVTEKYILKTYNQKDLKEKFAKLNISEITLNSDIARTVNNELDGVQVELLLANKLYETTRQDTYSIPVVLKNEELYDEPLTINRIERWGCESRRLPQNLFYGIQMYEFDPIDPNAFSLDWDKYKSTNK